MYEQSLAALHHAHFGDLARSGAGVLIERLRQQGHDGGTVVELACGSGVSSGILCDHGYDVVGVDVSADMLALARVHAPRARFVEDSLWRAPLPGCVAVTALGEAFCYQAGEQQPDRHLLAERLEAIAAALQPGGVLLFDVATPGRSGPPGRRRVSWNADGAFIFVDEQEHNDPPRLTRTIDTFVPEGDRHRHQQEVHRLALYDASDVEAALEHTGLVAQRLDAFGTYAFPRGWTGFAATKE